MPQAFQAARLTCKVSAAHGVAWGLAWATAFQGRAACQLGRAMSCTGSSGETTWMSKCGSGEHSVPVRSAVRPVPGLSTTLFLRYHMAAWGSWRSETDESSERSVGANQPAPHATRTRTSALRQNIRYR